MRCLVVCLPTFVLFLCAGYASIAQAESFQLRTGGQVEGELLNPKRAASDPYLVKTAHGVTLSLTRESVEKMIVEREAVGEYERLRPKVAETADDHWKMAEWCREAGLKSQREFHLQQVLVHQPDHEQAHLALGHSKLGGKWQRMDEYMSGLGYVKHEGLWRTRQEVELAKANAELEEHQIGWRKQIRIWRGWIGKKREAEAIANFRAIKDPLAAPELIDALEQKGQPRELRLVMIDVLAELKGNPAEGAFIKLAMADPDQGVRDACLDQLVRRQSKAAVHQYMGLIRSEKTTRELINRAAAALGRLGDQIATTALIDALVTTHEVVITPGSSSTSGLGPISSSFGSDPSNPNSGGFSAGAPKPVKVKRDFENDAVLGALSALHPGVNFAFNESAWKRWYAEKNQPPKVDLRRVE